MKLLGVMALLMLSACAHSIHEVYVSDFGSYPKLEQGEVVKARSEQFVVLGFVQETAYVNQARAQLMAQCPDGEISGISTQYSTSLGFFSWTNKILMQGLCTKATVSANSFAPNGKSPEAKLRRKRK